MTTFAIILIALWFAYFLGAMIGSAYDKTICIFFSAAEMFILTCFIVPINICDFGLLSMIIIGLSSLKLLTLAFNPFGLSLAGIISVLSSIGSIVFGILYLNPGILETISFL